MKVSRALAAVAVIAFAVVSTACGGGAAPATSSGSQPAATQSSSGASAGSAQSAAPTKPAPTIAPTATVAPKPTAAPTPATASSALTDLLAKVKALGDYSYDYKMNASGMAVEGKAFVKGTKIREEMAVTGMKTVTLIDSAAKVVYTLMPDQKMAVKMDFSKLQGNNSSPTDQVSGMPANTKEVGSETVDGKPTTIYEYTKDGSTGRFWIWTEKGVPLKAEITAAGTKVTMEFTNYKFGSLEAGLFEVPKDYTVTDTSALSGSGLVPTAATKP